MSAKVLVVAITADLVRPECWVSIVNQWYDDLGWIVVGNRPKKQNENQTINLYANCSANRNAARRLALASDAEYFLFVDSDIQLPPNAVEEFVRQARDDHRVLGGWYKVGDGSSGYWVAGKWVADNVFANFKGSPPASVIKTDLVGMGCAFMDRTVLEEIHFEDGCDLLAKTPEGDPILVGECGAFGNRCAEKGYPMFMVGEVVCNHLKN